MTRPTGAGVLAAAGALALTLVLLSLLAPTPATTPWSPVALPGPESLTADQAALVSATAGRTHDDDAHPSLCDPAGAEAFAAELLSAWGVPPPVVTVAVPDGADPPRAVYLPEGDEVRLAGCQPAYVLAHEVGHYALDRAATAVGVGPVALAGEAFAGGDWIGGAGQHLELEYAAHCVGNVLYGEAPGTRCPDPTLRERAVGVLLAAGGGSVR